jgi:L-aminopeptidase/D-esterase-like protein
VVQGLVGAGTGATCAKWRGEKIPGGIGSAAVRVGGATVAALVAVNALGDVFSLEGESLTGGPPVAGPLAKPPQSNQNTTLAVVATDAALTRAQLGRLLVRAHDAYGACLRPAHTSFDGDICFAVSAGTVPGEPHNLAEAAFEAVGRAIANAVVASRS